MNALLSAREPHAFLGIDREGRTCTVQTSGNPYGHIVLRGGSDGPNYDSDTVGETLPAARGRGGSDSRRPRRLQSRQLRQRTTDASRSPSVT